MQPRWYWGISAEPYSRTTHPYLLLPARHIWDPFKDLITEWFLYAVGEVTQHWLAPMEQVWGGLNPVDPFHQCGIGGLMNWSLDPMPYQPIPCLLVWFGLISPHHCCAVWLFCCSRGSHNAPAWAIPDLGITHWTCLIVVSGMLKGSTSPQKCAINLWSKLKPV